MNRTRNRYTTSLDENHKEIVKAFEDHQCLVWDTSRWGGGFPDLVVQRLHPHTGTPQTFLVEVKDGKKSPSRRKLNKLQEAFHSVWHCDVVESVDDVVDLLRVNVI